MSCHVALPPSNMTTNNSAIAIDRAGRRQDGHGPEDRGAWERKEPDPEARSGTGERIRWWKSPLGSGGAAGMPYAGVPGLSDSSPG